VHIKSIAELVERLNGLFFVILFTSSIELDPRAVHSSGFDLDLNYKSNISFKKSNEIKKIVCNIIETRSVFFNLNSSVNIVCFCCPLHIKLQN